MKDGGRGIVVANCQEVNVESNIISECSKEGIRCYGSILSGITLEDNEVYGCKGSGILLRDGKVASLKGNRVHECGEIGIFLYNFSRAEIIGCQSYSNGQTGPNFDGIRIEDCNHVICSLNHCFDLQKSKTQRYGIILTGESSYCQITGNNLQENDVKGVHYNATGEGNIIKDTIE
ncbi:MAG: right-handed parallel beta-helix repeat-containing protein [Candidatus Hecatellaceae archaeon]